MLGYLHFKDGVWEKKFNVDSVLKKKNHFQSNNFFKSYCYINIKLNFFLLIIQKNFVLISKYMWFSSKIKRTFKNLMGRIEEGERFD